MTSKDLVDKFNEIHEPNGFKIELDENSSCNLLKIGASGKTYMRAALKVGKELTASVVYQKKSSTNKVVLKAFKEFTLQYLSTLWLEKFEAKGISLCIAQPTQ